MGLRLWVCSFATPYWKKAMSRLSDQLKDLEIFDEIIMYESQDIDTNLIEKHQEFIQSHSKGYGHFIWKPMVILQTLQKMQTGDIMLYLDSGCHVLQTGKDRLQEYIKLVDEHKLLAFQLTHQEKYWTKADLREQFLDVSPESLQLVGGIHLWKKCDETVKLASEWYELMQSYHNIDDSASSNHTEVSGFREHRHDQSCFSLLVKSKKIGLILPDETWWSDGFDKHKNFPIHARRDRN
jgi:hypothetical protein